MDMTKAKYYILVLQALLTSNSDNLKYAPEGETVTEKLASLSNAISAELSEQLKGHRDTMIEATTMSLVLGTLSHPSDCLAHAPNLNEWVKICVLRGKQLAEGYRD